MADEKKQDAPPQPAFQQQKPVPKKTIEELEEEERERRKYERRARKDAFAAALGPDFKLLTEEELMRELWPQIVRAFKLGFAYERVAELCQKQQPPITLTKEKWMSIPQYLFDQEERRQRAKEKAAKRRK